jgi:glycosyltransferase involved in cell wall biosynthesis
MSKKLLVIADLVHASPRIPGLLDPLIENDWEIHILTPILPNNAQAVLGFPIGFTSRVKIIETIRSSNMIEKIRPLMHGFRFSAEKSLLEQAKGKTKSAISRKMVQALFTSIMSVFAFPDLEKNWRRIAIKEFKKLQKEHNYSAILSSTPFPTSHRIANEISREYGIKWIADFRDPWTGNPVYQYGRIRQVIEKRLEIRTMKNASKVITVSEVYAKVISEINRREAIVIPNGFIDYSEMSSPKLKTEIATLLHTGNIYLPFHDLTPLFEGIRLALDEGKIGFNTLQVEFYGRYETEIERAISDNNLETIVKQKGYIPRLECVEKQKSSSALIFFNWEDTKNSGLSHLKFYEYINSGNLILCIGKTENLYTDILHKYPNGFSATTKEEVAEFIYKLAEDMLPLKEVSPSLIYQYSYKNQSSKLLSILNSFE